MLMKSNTLFSFVVSFFVFKNKALCIPDLKKCCVLEICVSSFYVCSVMHLELILLCGVRLRSKFPLEKHTYFPLGKQLRTLTPPAEDPGSYLRTGMASHSHLQPLGAGSDALLWSLQALHAYMQATPPTCEININCVNTH